MLLAKLALLFGLTLGGLVTDCTKDSSVAGRCTQWEPMLAQYAPPGGWDVVYMSKVMYRESRCNPSVRSRTSDSGLLQINDINHRYLRTALGEWVDQWTLRDAAQNIRAGAALCVYWKRAGYSCYRAWG